MMGKNKSSDLNSNRRDFLRLSSLGLGASMMGFSQLGCSPKTEEMKLPEIQGFERSEEDPSEGWTPFSDRKVRVGLVGYGVCKFAADFGFQNHPNVEVVAVSDLFPDRCAELAKVTGCNKTYPSLEELVKDDNIEAVFVATDAPSHAKHCMEVLKHGKHVAVAVPATFGSIEEGEQLLEVVRSNKGLKYMMFETSCFRKNLYEMKTIYDAGGFGEVVYSEGEYWHYSPDGIDSYKKWRDQSPPQWYPTHNTAYYVGVTGGTFTEVSCIGRPSLLPKYADGNNQYKNPYATEIAFFKTINRGISRQSLSNDTPGHGAEAGRLRGTRGSYNDGYEGLEKNLPNLKRPSIPPGVPAGGHGGSHGRLMNEFIASIIQDRKPLVDIVTALNMTIPGIVAHESAMRGGEWLKIPQYT